MGKIWKLFYYIYRKIVISPKNIAAVFSKKLARVRVQCELVYVLCNNISLYCRLWWDVMCSRAKTTISVVIIYKQHTKCACVRTARKYPSHQITLYMDSTTLQSNHPSHIVSHIAYIYIYVKFTQNCRSNSSQEHTTQNVMRSRWMWTLSLHAKRF